MNKVLSEAARSLHRLPDQAPADSAAWQSLAIDLTPNAAGLVEDRLAAANYLSQLSTEEREVLRLRFDEDLSGDEIAAHLGISSGNARVRVSRALAALKAIAGAGPKGVGR